MTTITDADVIGAYPELPGLAVLLNPARLHAATERLGCGPLRLERLRLKPGASVTAMLRPTEGDGSWVLARGFAPEPWAAKRGKDLVAAERAGLPGWELPSHRLLFVPAAADRSLPGLAALRPDTGSAVRVRGLAAPVTVRTLSHNPARRWVGLADGRDARRVLRRHSDGRAEVLPWVPGRTWRPGDPLPALLTGLPTAGLVAVDLSAGLNAAVDGLHMLHRPWGERAAVVVASIEQGLAAQRRVPAHGDLTPDQVVIGPTGTTVLDWDRAGRWPRGWDAATWTAGLIVAGWHPADGTSAVEGATCRSRPVAPEVLAAAAVLRGPEPFRRRHPSWASRTAALLTHAERALA